MSVREQPAGVGEDADAPSPAAIDNRPGLATIAYRAGTHASFKRAMLARLASADLPGLHALGSRADDDFTIALLDAWAAVADVQTFYSERIANEYYLRTAGERRSLLHLAGLIGYAPRPGLAAGTYLAFALDDAPGAPEQAARPMLIEAGLKVQSVPGPSEKPQIFETVERIQARAEWNILRPRLTERHRLPIPNQPNMLVLQGVATNLRAGDQLLVAPEDNQPPQLRRIAALAVAPEYQQTLVQLEEFAPPKPADPEAPEPGQPGKPDPLIEKVNATLQTLLKRDAPTRGRLTRIAISDASKTSVQQFRLRARVLKIKTRHVLENLAATRQPSPGVLAFRTRAAIFGHHAPRWRTLTAGQQAAFEARKQTWANLRLAAYHIHDDDADADPTAGDQPASQWIYLDTIYPQIVAGSWVVLKNASSAEVYVVKDTTEVSRSDFTLSARVTRLTLDRAVGPSFTIRGTTVLAQSEVLQLGRVPIDALVEGSDIQLNGWVDGLYTGQGLIFCGELADTSGVRECEYATIAAIEYESDADGYTQIALSAALKNSYKRPTLTINANVARATHGETLHEVLGSGDAGKPHQRFTLGQPPLTYVSAPTPSGAASTLAVRVDDLLWREVPTLYGHAPDERIYTTRTDHAGATTIQFGARLPSGQLNVRATYRRGSGLGGLVAAGQLSMPLTRVLGLKGVTNPLAAGGAADPEALEDMRRNAPLTVLTLDRIVSLQDYEDFARAFSGIAKALASWSWNGQTRSVLVTVAGPDGAHVERDSELHSNLAAAMRQNGDPFVPLQLQSYQPAFFGVAASLKPHPDALPDLVLAAAKQALAAHFSFDTRAFGQPVTLGEVMAVLQATPGVLAVDIDRLIDGAAADSVDNDLRPAATTPLGAMAARPTELLLLAPEIVHLTVTP